MGWLILFLVGSFFGGFLFGTEGENWFNGQRIDPLLPLPGWRLILLVVFLAISFIWAKLSYYFYRYELTDDSVRKELGIISKKYVSIPYDRIQNVDIHRSLFSRLLGLSDLQIQTAGAHMSGDRSGASEGRLPGLSKDVAEALRNELIKRAQRQKGQGL